MQEVEESVAEVVDVVSEFEGGKVLFVRKVEGRRDWKQEVVRRVVGELEELVRVLRGEEARVGEFEGV